LLWASFIAASIIVVPLFILFPKLSKYNLEFISTKILEGIQTVEMYDDLDSDGKLEKILFNKEDGVSPSILTEMNGRILYHNHYAGKVVDGGFYKNGDYNLDGQKEIFLITYRNDSIFLNIFEGISNIKIVESLFISKYKKLGDKIDFSVQDCHLEDLDNDGYKEFVIPLMCGYSYSTRKLCIYNIKNKTLFVSPLSGVTLADEIFFYDINNDGCKEIFGKSVAISNCPENYPYSDQYSWLMVLNNHASYVFDPFKIGSYPSTHQVRPIICKEQLCIAVFHKNSRDGGNLTFLAIYSNKGKLIKRINIPYEKNLRESTFVQHYPESNPTQLILYRGDGLIEIYDENLYLISSDIESPHQGKLVSYDLDGDGEKEHVFYKRNKGAIVVSRNNFRNQTETSVEMEQGDLLLTKVDLEKKEFSLQREDRVFTFNYYRNHLYSIRFLLYFLTWLTVSCSVFLFAYLLQAIIRRRYETEKRINQMQIAAIESQLNPHFNLNILNSIGSLYETHEKEKAQYYFGKYSKLLRQSLFQSGQIAIPIYNELEFTLNYLELEKLRMNEHFEYCVQGEENLPDIEVPKMLIHTFVENAVKHGLKHLNEKGLLEIEFLQQKNSLKIFISDNGIGRVKAKQYSLMSTGKGLEIVNRSLQLYFELENRSIEYLITDIYDEAGEAAGTKVEIDVPM
jgi:hypothetical protein